MGEVILFQETSAVDSETVVTGPFPGDGDR